MCASKDLCAPGPTRATLPGPALPPHPRGARKATPALPGLGAIGKGTGRVWFCCTRGSGNRLLFPVTEPGMWGKPLHWPGHLSGLCCARTAPLQLWEGSTSPHKGQWSLVAPIPARPLEPIFVPMGLSHRLACPPSPSSEAHLSCPLWAQALLSYQNLGSLVPWAPAPAPPPSPGTCPPCLGPSGTPHSSGQSPVDGGRLGPRPQGGPTGPTRRVLGFTQDQK